MECLQRLGPLEIIFPYKQTKYGWNEQVQISKCKADFGFYSSGVCISKMDFVGADVRR